MVLLAQCGSEGIYRTFNKAKDTAAFNYRLYNYFLYSNNTYDIHAAVAIFYILSTFLTYQPDNNQMIAVRFFFLQVILL